MYLIYPLPNEVVVDEMFDWIEISDLIQLRQVNPLWNKMIIKKITHIYSAEITDDGISPFINLTSLNLLNNRRITDKSVSKLTNLTSLYPWDSITDESIW